ncbi:hypothetical protein Tco_0963786 [Tanacetum coccineum]
MIGCKVMRTLASVEFEIILIIGLPCCFSSRSVRCLENVVEMSQAYLVETKTPESPHTIASPIPLLDSTPPTRHVEDSVDSGTSGARRTPSNFTTPLLLDHPLTHASPTLVPFICRTASAFHKRFRSSYKSLPSSSPRDLPSRKHYWGTFELVKDDDEEEDDEVEDEEIEESLDFDMRSEDQRNMVPTIRMRILPSPRSGDKGPMLARTKKGAGIE